MKHIKLFESFNDFPNNKEDIYKTCEKYGITNYTINDDMSIDVDGDVVLSYRGLVKLPLKFNKVSGYFNCYTNELKSLEGSPKEVSGNFVCIDNKLTTLEGSPEIVVGDFYCQSNKLKSLEGSPKEVGGEFNCGNNLLVTLEGGPEEFGSFYCYTNPIYSLFELFGRNYKWFKESIKEYSWLDGTEIDKMRLIDVFLDEGRSKPDLSKIHKIYTLI